MADTRLPKIVACTSGKSEDRDLGCIQVSLDSFSSLTEQKHDYGWLVKRRCVMTDFGRALTKKTRFFKHG